MKRETDAGGSRTDPVEESAAAIAVATKAQARRIEKEAFQEGWRASASTIPAVLAWGIVSGMAMVKSGMTIWQALAMTLTVYAGSAQFAVLPLLAAHTPLIVIFLTAMIVNLRFVIFSAAVAPHFAHLPWYRRVWYGYFNGDISMGFFRSDSRRIRCISRPVSSAFSKRSATRAGSPGRSAPSSASCWPARSQKAGISVSRARWP